MPTKILKNTTAGDKFYVNAGVFIPALTNYEIQESEYLVWAHEDTIDEVKPDIAAGDIVVNDGVNDLSAVIDAGEAESEAVRHLRYPDTAFNVRFLSDPERLNGFVSKNVQEAIEEAIGGAVPISPTTTVDATPTVAFSETLDDDKSYWFTARVVVRRLDDSGAGLFEEVVNVRREGGGAAEIIGCVFQAVKQQSGFSGEVDWQVSGNDVRLVVTGEAAKTIKWQPQLEREDVS